MYAADPPESEISRPSARRRATPIAASCQAGWGTQRIGSPAPRMRLRASSKTLWARPSGPAHNAKGLALENLLGLRERRQSRLRLRERACAHVDRRGLRRDRDLLARGGVATLAGLRGRLEAHRQLDEIADLHLLRIADLA